MEECGKRVNRAHYSNTQRTTQMPFHKLQWFIAIVVADMRYKNVPFNMCINAVVDETGIKSCCSELNNDSQHMLRELVCARARLCMSMYVGA